MGSIKYPEIEVRLTGFDSNAYSIIGAVVRGLKTAGVSREERELCKKELMAGSYEDLLNTASNWVTIS